MNIKEIKKKHGLKTRDLARMFNVSYDTFRNSSGRKRYEKALEEFYKIITNPKN